MSIPTCWYMTTTDGKRTRISFERLLRGLKADGLSEATIRRQFGAPGCVMESATTGSVYESAERPARG